MAGKDNSTASAIDKTSFFWTGQCGVCHPGGGPGEFDRDGELYFDVATGELGYEKLGKTPLEVALDGDYAFVNPGNGMLMAAPWQITGVSEPDCLACHRRDRSIDLPTQTDQNTYWRQVTLRGMANLKNSAGDPVPAYAAAPTSAQGWFSTLDVPAPPPGKPPTAATLDIDYAVGLADGSLLDVGGELRLDGDQLIVQPKDFACWGCHALPDAKKRGRVWFDADEDVHYGWFANLNDADPTNDIAPQDSTGCTACHPSEEDHDFAKGNSFAGSVRNETDYTLRTCRDCHLASSPLKDPDAPEPTSAIHNQPEHLDQLSCQLCHAPYKTKVADLVVDNAVTGSGVGYGTEAFLSADPLDPGDPDKTRWHPALEWKTDKDGVDRLFPAKLLNTVWWGDWDQNGTPGDLTDDVIQPVILWRLRQATGGAALPGVVDDNGDGKPEVNTEAEILAYIQELATFLDTYGNPIAARPILIKGGLAWYEDAGSPSGVSTFELHGSGIKAESWVPFSIDHNIRQSDQALGAGNSCGACHQAFNGGQPTEVLDRKVLVDPFGTDGQPVYSTPRDMLGLNVL